VQRVDFASRAVCDMVVPIPSPPPLRRLLFTAFEPSGDAHAAPVIAELRRRRPEVEVFAWGGPKMRAAGATIVEATGADAVMGAGSLAKVAEHYRMNGRLRRWLADHPVNVHVPVDSPAANFPICKITRRAGCRIVHLVAPQIWAWGAWRIRKLARLTDHVLCLLPFEEEYFRSRGVKATFIGHPVMSEPWPAPPAIEPCDDERAKARASELPRIALLPGSRPSEIRHNLPSMIATVDGIRRATYPDMAVRIVSADDAAAALAHRVITNLPRFITIVVDQLHQTLEWADAALVCSGTATLNVVRHDAPMVAMFRMNLLPWLLLGRWMVRSPLRALPNIVAARRVVPEFIPHFGSDEPIAEALTEVLTDGASQDGQREAFAMIRSFFEAHDPAREAADVIEAVMARA